jgi:hypothetical protein
MDDKRSINFIASSNFIIGLILIELIKAILTGYGNLGKDVWSMEIIMIFLMVLASYKTRQGHTWPKYIVLLLLLFTVIGLWLAINNGQLFTFAAIITFVQVVLLVWVLWLLFTVPKSIDKSSLDGEI